MAWVTTVRNSPILEVGLGDDEYYIPSKEGSEDKQGEDNGMESMGLNLPF